MSTPTPMPLDALVPRPSLAATHPATHLPSEMGVSTEPAPAPTAGATHLPSEIGVSTGSRPAPTNSTRTHLLILLALWLILYVIAAFTPPLLDDADATHAQASQAMLSTNDWVTLHVDGIRYLEKPPLPYWITAVSLKLFAPSPQTKPSPSAPDPSQIRAAPFIRGSIADEWSEQSLLRHERALTFAVHFPLALTLLGLALLGYTWARQAFTPTTALLTALFLLTSTGTFLFTRVFIPDALLSLLLAFTLYALLRSLNPVADMGAPGLASDTWVRRSTRSTAIWPYLMWATLALAVLTKGLIAIVFILATTLTFLAYTRQLHQWRKLKPLTGFLLFLTIAAPWHILAGLRNTGGANGHGFFWFYFINEHVLRFLGRRIPRDYNKLPATLYWSLHLVWLFPWSLFAPAALLTAYRNRRTPFARPSSRPDSVILSDTRSHADAVIQSAAEVPRNIRLDLNSSHLSHPIASTASPSPTFRHQTIHLLLIFSALVLVFFSVSTNQEYYTFPVYLPILMLLAAALTSINTATTAGAPHLASEMWVSTNPNPNAVPLDPTLRRTLTFTFATYTLLGLAIAAALAYGLFSARHLPFVPDIGDLLAHRDVGDYTLSLSHFFDLTGPSFAALRLPAAIALAAFLLGPAIAWLLFIRNQFLPALFAIAATSSVFLIAAHLAFIRFNPMLSSVNFARTLQTLERTNQISPTNEVLIFGDQAFGSSIPFYLNRQVKLVDGRSTSMLFGSTFPDAPAIFLTSADLLAHWGNGPRKLLFVPLEKRDEVDHLLGPHQILLQQTSGKGLITDRPLAPGS